MSTRLLTDEQAPLCGIGEGANCCAFLSVGAQGFLCLQRSSLADMIYSRAHAGTSLEQRTPESDFPACQMEGRS